MTKRALWSLLLISATPALADESFHFQATTVTQAHPGFDSPYFGPNSMSGSYESRTSLTSTIFVGHSLWSGAGFYIDPELSALGGLSGTHGIAGFPNGEIYRVDSPDPKLNISRLFLRQDFGFGGETEALEPDLNQIARTLDVSRLTVVVGKFSLSDYFDDNTYSHDPRTQFLNWALMDTGAWDYAADTRGYTWGIYLELHQPRWTFRIASVLVPAYANQLALDPHILQVQGNNAELEYRYAWRAHPGKLKLLGYRNVAHMGLYRQAIDDPAAGLDITATRGPDRVKYGFALNAEQELTADLGVFARAGWNDGATETWAFTEIDSTLAAGASLKGAAWSRPEDTVGAAFVVNGLSSDHAQYLEDGGAGFMVGDGALNYAPEAILETYYSYKLIKEVALTGDFQFVENPGYNHDRGPVEIFGIRAHYEF